VAIIDDNLKTALLKEVALLTGLFFAGLVVLPLCIYLVGQAVFGEYGSGGFASFYGDLHGRFRGGDPLVWFLLLSPYVLWQLARLTARAFRHASGPGAVTEQD
jgi:hypothetical protein